MATEGRRYTATHGKWIIADSIPDNPLGLLSVGDEYFAGESPRGRLDRPGAALWLREANKVRHTGQTSNQIAKWENGMVRVYVEAIRAPETENIVGVAGIITDPGAPLPERPGFGVVEWGVEAATGKVFRQAWDSGMGILYEGAAPEGNLPKFINETIALRGKDAFEGAIRSSFGDRDSRYLVKYYVHPARDRTREKQLEISGWTSDDPDTHEIFWLRGIVRAAKNGTPLLLPAKEFFTTDLYQKAITLADDRLFIRIDTKTWDFYCHPDAWAIHGLRNPNMASLATVLDTRGMTDIQTAVSTGASGHLDVRLRRGDGWASYEMKWTRLSNEGPGAQFVLGYLRPRR